MCPAADKQKVLSQVKIRHLGSVTRRLALASVGLLLCNLLPFLYQFADE
jgi:hypothetical protein